MRAGFQIPTNPGGFAKKTTKKTALYLRFLSSRKALRRTSIIYEYRALLAKIDEHRRAVSANKC